MFRNKNRNRIKDKARPLRRIVALGLTLALLVPPTSHGASHKVDSWEAYREAIIKDLSLQEKNINISFAGGGKYGTIDDIVKKIKEEFLEAENQVGDFYRQNRYSVSFDNSKYRIDKEGKLYFNTGNYNLLYKNTNEDLKKLDLKVDEILKDLIKEGMSQADQVKTIYNFVGDSFVYKKISKDENDIGNILKERNILLGLDGGGVVCEAYAMLFEMMATKLGIENKIVTGTDIETGVGHVWNMVKIGDDWYYVDPTVGDDDLDARVEGYKNKYGDLFTYEDYRLQSEKDGQKIRRTYLLTSEKLLEKTHLWDKSQYPKADKIYSFIE